MDKHNFCYNYGFLADWLKANSKKRYDVLKEMGMSDYKTLQNWIEGETMMPLAQLMKFCNLYNVPITAFFFDELADEDSIFSQIPVNAQIEPAGGWPDQKRKAGIKVCDPRTDIHMDSNLPAYVKTSGSTKTISDNATEQETEDTMSTAERMRYIDIIEKQNNMIRDLTKENQSLYKSIYENANK